MNDLPVVNLLKLAQRTGDSVRGHLRELELLMESGKECLLAEAKRLVEDCGPMPMLVSYSADGTPVKATMMEFQCKRPSGYVTKRKARQSAEVLVEHVFLRYFDALGTAYSATIVKEPTPLLFGKSGAAQWAVARKSLFLAREHGHTGISICHYVFDGGDIHLFRRASQEHMLRNVQRKQATVDAGLDHKEQLFKDV